MDFADRIRTLLRVEKAEHLSDADKARIRKMYGSGDGKSIRDISDNSKYTRHQVAAVVDGMAASTKTDEKIHEKQRRNARFLGEKLPQHIVQANHEGRNKEIASRPDSTMESPVKKVLREMGISFQSQVDVRRLTGSNDVEAGIVDFVIPSKKVVIEADGPRHTLKNVAARSAKKDIALKAAGYRVIRVTPKDMKELKSFLQNALS